MTEQIVTSIVTVLMAIIGVAILAVLVSNNSNTSGVLKAGGNAFTGILGAATSPISGTYSSGTGLG